MSAPAVLDVLALPVPDGSRARRAWLRVVAPAEVRIRCGISRVAVARALGVSETAVWGWETGRRAPLAAKGTAYLRVIAALARHLEIPESRDDDTDEPLMGDEKGNRVTLWNTPPKHLAGGSPLSRAVAAFMKATQELDAASLESGPGCETAVRRRLDAYAAAQELTEAVRDAAAERDKLQRACETLGKVVVWHAETLYCAWIEISRDDLKSAAQWILNGIPDVDDNPPDQQWNGTETAQEWFDRTRDAR